MIDTTQIGTTVLFLYPKPNGRYPPSGLYKIEGFVRCIVVNIIKNKTIAILTLCTRIKFLVIFINLIYKES